MFPFDMPGKRRLLAERRLADVTLESNSGVNLPVSTKIVLGPVFLPAILALESLAFVLARNVHF